MNTSGKKTRQKYHIATLKNKLNLSLVSHAQTRLTPPPAAFTVSHEDIKVWKLSERPATILHLHGHIAEPYLACFHQIFYVNVHHHIA